MLIPVLFALSSFSGAVASGQSAGNTASSIAISGSVADPTGAVVPAVSIEVFGPARRTARTDERGRFHIDGLPAGSYRLTAARDGFATREIRLDLAAGPPGDITLQLDLAPVAETIETVSKIPETTLHTPFLVTRVPAKELRDTAAATLDEALRTVAGLQHGTQGNAFTRVATRGLRDTADVLVLLDGVPFRQLNGSADLTLIPVSILQGVEFVKGTASSMYGRSAIGGVMQFFTVPEAGPKPSAEVTFGAASFSTFDGQGAVDLPYRGGRVAAAAAVSRSDGFQDRATRDTNFLTVVGDQTVSRRAHLRLHYLTSDVDAARGSIVPLGNGRPMFGITRRDNFGIPGARFEGRIHSSTGKVDSELSDKILVTNTLNFNRYDRFSTGGITIVPPPTASNKGWSESEARQDTWLNDTLLQWHAEHGNVRSTLLGGATVEWGDQDQASPTFSSAPTYRGPDYVTPVAGASAGNDPRGIRGADVTSYFNQFIASLYLQERLQAGRFGAMAGLRWDRFHQTLTRSDTTVVSDYTGGKVSPRVGADVALVRADGFDMVAFGNVAQGFRPQFPALSTQNNITVPQLLRPEVTRNLEGGIRMHRHRVSGQMAVFNMRKIDGQRSFRSGPDDFVFVNATTQVKGIEGELRALLAGGHSLFANYAFQNARNLEFRPTLTTNFDGYRLRMAPRHIAGLGATLAVSRVAWTTSVSYVGSRPLRDNIVNPQVLPSYALLNTSVSARLGRAQMVVSATNLTDRYYIADDFSSQDAGNPGMPRRIALQLRYRF